METPNVHLVSQLSNKNEPGTLFLRSSERTLTVYDKMIFRAMTTFHQRNASFEDFTLTQQIRILKGEWFDTLLKNSVMRKNDHPQTFFESLKEVTSDTSAAERNKALFFLPFHINLFSYSPNDTLPFSFIKEVGEDEEETTLFTGENNHMPINNLDRWATKLIHQSFEEKKENHLLKTVSMQLDEIASYVENRHLGKERGKGEAFAVARYFLSVIYKTEGVSAKESTLFYRDCLFSLCIWLVYTFYTDVKWLLS